MAPTGANGDFIDSSVLATVHMHWMQSVKPDIPKLVSENFLEEEIKEARKKLIDYLGKSGDYPGGRQDTDSRSAVTAYVQDIMAMFQSSDMDGEVLDIMVSSKDLKKIPSARVGLDQSEVVPISSRMGDIEKVVKDLARSFNDFKQESIKRLKTHQAPGQGEGHVHGQKGQAHRQQLQQGQVTRQQAPGQLSSLQTVHNGQQGNQGLHYWNQNGQLIPVQSQFFGQGLGGGQVSGVPGQMVWMGQPNNDGPEVVTQPTFAAVTGGVQSGHSHVQQRPSVQGHGNARGAADAGQLNQQVLLQVPPPHRLPVIVSGRNNGRLRDRSLSTGSKRSANEMEADNSEVQNDAPYQPVNNRGRRKKPGQFGTNRVTLAGAEAAPVDFFIGNTRPDSTEELIKQALVMCGENHGDMPAELKQGDIQVKLLNNLDEEPNPRTKCWKVTVPYIFREVLGMDTFFPNGWSHRKFHNKKTSGQRSKKDQNKKPRTAGYGEGPVQGQEQQQH